MEKIWKHVYICITESLCYIAIINMGFPSGSVGKESACNAGDLGSIPGLGKSPGEGNGNPLQYSCLENSMDRGAWQAIVHRIAVGHDCETNFHFQLLIHCISTTPINLKKTSNFRLSLRYFECHMLWRVWILLNNSKTCCNFHFVETLNWLNSNLKLDFAHWGHQIKAQLIILSLAENSGSWWWTGKPGMLQSMGSKSQTGPSDWIELKWKLLWICHLFMCWGLAGDLGKFMLRILESHCLDRSLLNAPPFILQWFQLSHGLYSLPQAKNMASFVCLATPRCNCGLSSG